MKSKLVYLYRQHIKSLPPEQKEFYRLFNKYHNFPRYKEVSLESNGLKLIIPDALSYIWQFKEIMVDGLYKFETDSKQPIIVDCGANIGLSVAYFKRQYPNAKILAIEADKKIFEYLSNNLERNKLLTNVELINKAAWIHNDGVSFNSEGADGGAVNDDAGTNTIPSLKLRELLDGFLHVDFLKIDIEGAESTVIPDLDDSLKKVDRLFIEYHSFPGEEQQLPELLHVLSKVGFRYFINSPTAITQPFLECFNEMNMDLQLNIFAYRP